MLLQKRTHLCALLSVDPSIAAAAAAAEVFQSQKWTNDDNHSHANNAKHLHGTTPPKKKTLSRAVVPFQAGLEFAQAVKNQDMGAASRIGDLYDEAIKIAPASPMVYMNKTMFLLQASSHTSHRSDRSDHDLDHVDSMQDLYGTDPTRGKPTSWFKHKTRNFVSRECRMH